MGFASIVVTFVLCLFLNVFINSWDVYSDIALSYNTLTFNLGDSILLTGCRVCHGKEDKEIFSLRNSSCQQCLTKNDRFSCGHSYQLLEKLFSLEEDEKCEQINERFGVLWNATIRSHDFLNSSCSDEKDLCCVENKERTKIKYPLDGMDKRILAIQTDQLSWLRNNFHYDVYILSGKLSSWHCQGVYFEMVNWNSINLQPFLQRNITKVKKQNEYEWYFTFRRTIEGRIFLQRGFNSSDECGMYVREKHHIHVTNNGESCQSNSCLLHLQYLKMRFNISSLENWKTNTFFNRAQKMGGRTCRLLWQYGIASLVPSILNVVFHLLLFREDMKLDQASKYEILFVFIQFYPQWKALRILFSFICNGSESVLNYAKDQFDKDIGSLEPFIESAFQVCAPFLIFNFMALVNRFKYQVFIFLLEK